MERSTLENFDIQIERREGNAYPVHVLYSTAGQARGALPASAVGLRQAGRFKWLGSFVPGADTGDQIEPERWKQAKRFGQTLFDALFSGEVRSRFEVSLNLVKLAGKKMRVRLWVQPPELTALPWELMNDKRNDRFLALSGSTPIIRYVERTEPIPPLATQYPLRILVVMSSPLDRTPLDLDGEVRRMRKALKPLEIDGMVDIQLLRQANLLALQRKLREEKYNVLHYMGHADFSPEEEEGFLVFEDPARNSQRASAHQLAVLLQDEPTLRLVVLNACSTAEAASAAPFSGVATALVQTGIPAVVAMQTTITDEAALQFSQAFYESLKARYPIDAAVTEGRRAISFLSNYNVEWAIPQLFSRIEDGPIFDFDARPVTPQPPRQPGTDTRVAPAPPSYSRPEVVDPGPHATPVRKPVAPAPLSQSRPESTDPVRQATPTDTVKYPETPDVPKPGDRSAQFVPAGKFIFGNNETQELAAFYIDIDPVTNEDYLRYVQATGSPAPATWSRMKYPHEKADHPVTGVSWHEAMAYAAWVGKRLPTPAEWEKAARGTEGRRFPWGEEFDPQACNTQEKGIGGTSPVGAHPRGASAFGVLDMAGNVWEWTTGEIKPRGLGREGTKRVLKGGAWNAPASMAECSAFSTAWPDERSETFGFRCVRSAE